MTCKNHPYYKGIRFPRSGCRKCYLIWATKNPAKAVKLANLPAFKAMLQSNASSS